VLTEILEHLVVTRGFRLTEDDRYGIEDIYGQFVTFGPSITYSSSIGGGRTGFGGRRGRAFPSYADLMRQHDGTGLQRGYLATEAQFQALKDMQERNLIVPVVGDFAGPQALRAVGRYVRQRGAVVGAFYTSNVEQYLFRNGVWNRFYANLATLPVDDRIPRPAPGPGRPRQRAGPGGGARARLQGRQDQHVLRRHVAGVLSPES
jgi:hypothetical protein